MSKNPGSLKLQACPLGQAEAWHLLSHSRPPQKTTHHGCCPSIGSFARLHSGLRLRTWSQSRHPKSCGSGPDAPRGHQAWEAKATAVPAPFSWPTRRSCSLRRMTATLQLTIFKGLNQGCWCQYNLTRNINKPPLAV